MTFVVKVRHFLHAILKAEIEIFNSLDTIERACVCYRDGGRASGISGPFRSRRTWSVAGFTK
jgi:hypothetical protein